MPGGEDSVSMVIVANPFFAAGLRGGMCANAARVKPLWL